MRVPQRQQLRHRRLVQPQFQLDGEPRLHGAQPSFGQAGARGLGVRTGDADQYRPVPGGLHGTQEPDRAGSVPGGPAVLGLRHRGLELGQVTGDAVGPQGVAVPDGDQQPGRPSWGPLGLEQLAEPCDVGAHHRDSAPGRRRTPDPVHQIGHPDHLPPAQQEHREHRTLLRGPERQFDGTLPGTQRAQQGEPEGLQSTFLHGPAQ